MSDRDDMQAEPWRFDFLGTMRRLERSDPSRPRIGESATAAEELVRLGQDPYMDFPASNLSKAELLSDGRLRVLVKFLGLLGPQGALPLATTEESLGWMYSSGDDAFPRFADLLNNRFLQLFFGPGLIRVRSHRMTGRSSTASRPTSGRWWVSARPRCRISIRVPDAGKLNFAGLAACADQERLAVAAAWVRGLFGVKVEIEEFVGSRLALEVWRADRRWAARNGQPRAATRSSARAAASASRTSSACGSTVRGYGPVYERFLPTGGPVSSRLTDLVFYYVGEACWTGRWSWPCRRPAVAPMRLGELRPRIGWTSWLSRPIGPVRRMRIDAMRGFHPATTAIRVKGGERAA